VIIIPLVFVTLPTNKILRFILSILMRPLDYAFPLAMQIVWHGAKGDAVAMG
jgi:hypothetical protein